MKVPYIVALGGTTRAGSSTEKALRWSLKAIAGHGAKTLLISGTELDLPAFYPDDKELPDRAHRMICELRKADGIIIGTPGYHGGISGLVKNALDYTEHLRDDCNPYFTGRAVGCVTTAAGEQGAVTTLEALRSVVHALRGWPTPMGVAIVTASPVFSESGNCLSERIASQLSTLSQQVFAFSKLSAQCRGSQRHSSVAV